MKRLLILLFLSLLFPHIAHSMQVSTEKAAFIELPALIFLKIIDKTNQEHVVFVNTRRIGNLKQSIEADCFHKAIPFQYHSLSTYHREELWNSTITFSNGANQLTLEVDNADLSYAKKLYFKLKRQGTEKELTCHTIDINPTEFNDVCLVTLKLAGEYFENSSMEVLHKRSSYFAQILRECGAHLNGVDPTKWTPLMKVTMLDEEEMILLLKAGADVNAQCSTTKTTALHIAASSGSLAALEILLLHGAAKNIDTQDTYGDTSLHGAVIPHYPQKAKLLIEAGAKLNIRNNKGYTPIGLAWKRLQNQDDSMRPVYELLRQAHIDRHHAYVKEQSVLMGLQ